MQRLLMLRLSRSIEWFAALSFRRRQIALSRSGPVRSTRDPSNLDRLIEPVIHLRPSTVVGYNHGMEIKSVGGVLREKNIIIRGADVFTEGGFTQVPNAILRSREISQGAKLVYAMLLSYAWYNNSCFPGQDRLAEDLSMSRRSVNTHIKELEAKQFIKVTRKGLGKPNLYELFLTATKAPIRPRRTSR